MSQRARGALGGELGTVAREWTRIGVTGFGGPPAHIALLRQLVVGRMRWMSAREFEDANAACSLLPGPASTQLAILCAYRVGGARGAVVGGLCFIVPAVVLVLALSVVFLSRSPPTWIRGIGAGLGAAVAAVALQAARELARPSLKRVHQRQGRTIRWAAYLIAGACGAALVGPYLVLVLFFCGLVELALQRMRLGASTVFFVPVIGTAATGGLAALAWVALKVGALSFGGGFVIIPLMQGDAVSTYHWLTATQFLYVVALGQVTPGPVVATIAGVGYAAYGIAGGVLAAAVGFAPSFSFILLGGKRFEHLRESLPAQAFLDGAGPAAIGAIAGAAIPLTEGLEEGWQFGLLAAAAIALIGLRRRVVETLVGAGIVGVAAVLIGAPLP